MTSDGYRRGYVSFAHFCYISITIDCRDFQGYHERCEERQQSSVPCQQGGAEKSTDNYAGSATEMSEISQRIPRGIKTFKLVFVLKLH